MGTMPLTLSWDAADVAKQEGEEGCGEQREAEPWPGRVGHEEVVKRWRSWEPGAREHSRVHPGTETRSLMVVWTNRAFPRSSIWISVRGGRPGSKPSQTLAEKASCCCSVLVPFPSSSSSFHYSAGRRSPHISLNVLVCHNCHFLNHSDKPRTHRLSQSRAEHPFPAPRCSFSPLHSLSLLRSISPGAGRVVFGQISLVLWWEGTSVPIPLPRTLLYTLVSRAGPSQGSSAPPLVTV